jgi:hypothetical protein
MSTVKPIEISEAEYAQLAENYGGYCVECRAEAYGVEPDARRYACESCGARAVYGAEELLIRGVIRFIEESGQES